MNITFTKDKATLTRDLERVGYQIERVAGFPEVPGRQIDVVLTNGVIVSWDRSEEMIWVQGPEAQRERVESCLSVLYDGNHFGRLLALAPGLAAGVALVILLTAVGGVF